MLIKTINLIAALIAAILFFVLMAVVEAKVTGVCSNCHTMHNSQGGSVVNSAGPQAFLMRMGGGTVTICWGCHAQTTALNILNLTPQIRHTNATDLAGGNFAWITGTKVLVNAGATTSNAGHNVSDTGVAEATLTVIPGDENANSILVPGVAGTTRLTCAGQYGCHGDRTEASVNLSMKGAHHTSDTVLKFGGPISEAGQGSTVGLSYRFLKGVKGGEETNWMGSSPSATVHNEYKGATAGVEGTISTPGGGTISGFCSECHGNFHGGSADIGGPTGTPWLRHPTDTSLPAAGEYTFYTGYNITVPVARQTIPSAISSTVTPGTDVIMCLSCHRAHASANLKMTRWDYKNATIGTAISGCNVCHRSKN